MDWTKYKLESDSPFANLATGKRKWLRMPRSERFRVRIAEMWCRANGDEHSGRIKRIVNFIRGRYYKWRSF